MKLNLLTAFAAAIFICFLNIRTSEAQGIITTIAGNGNVGYNGDSIAATLAELNDNFGVGLDGAGNIYVVDGENNRIRKIDASGIITTIAGNGVAGYSGDGGAATAAELRTPNEMAIDGSGNIYIADANNERIRKVDAAGIITTIAGNGTQGYNGDGIAATAAELSQPAGIALDGAGNIYIAEYYNDRIRKVDPSGIITTIAGTGSLGYSGDGGQATAAELQHPANIAVDNTGNLYIADLGNFCIRKVSASGIITTVAGNGIQGFSGDGGQATDAELDLAIGIRADTFGNLYIADENNARIREVNTLGIIRTIAGNGSLTYSGDGGQATDAGISGPTDVVIDGSGNLYIADPGDLRVRKVNGVPSAIEEKNIPTQFANIYPNPTKNEITINISGRQKNTELEIYNVIGQKVCSEVLHQTQQEINVGNQPPGLYTIYLSQGTICQSQKLVINQ